jgi:protoporphyrinogen oxidase
MPRIAVLGAGMAGMAAAGVLKDQDVTVFEAREEAGGHASSFRVGGFTFDEGPHVSFTPNQRIRDFLASSVEQQFFEHPSYATNYYRGIILKHPVQTNLRKLPPDCITECIADFVRAQYEDGRDISSYRDWCYKQLGRAISEKFTRLYTRKYWTLELEQLTTEWVSQRIYAPKLEEVLGGALGEAKGQHYYMSTFRYPARGGFGAYNRLLEGGSRIRFNKRVVEIDISRKRLTFADGSTEYFEYLISSLPLPELVRMLAGAPKTVQEAAAKLACSSHFLVSLGVALPVVSDAYWTYYYDEEIPYSRLSFPSMYTPYAAPPACSSIQAEVVHSRFRPLDSPDTVVERTIDALLATGVLHSRDEIIAVDARNVRYANVIFDFERSPNVAVVHGYLGVHGIERCGRYGDWEYLWTDQSILSGERAGNAVRAALGLEHRAFDAPEVLQGS